MRIAISEAQKALETGEGIAFGAVLVKDDKIIEQGHNMVLAENDPTSHAECNVIRKACNTLKRTNLSGFVLYSTCEPCPMCFTACWWAKISKIVYGVNLSDITFRSHEMHVDSEYLNTKGGSKIILESGLLKDECMKLYEK